VEVLAQNVLKDLRLLDVRLLVRINPIHEATKEYCSSKEEIDIAIANGADIIMLPFSKTLNEVAQFLTYVDGRV
jgi:citrate lyase beta subunit